MVRQRFIYCGIAAAFILSGVAQAQEMRIDAAAQP